MRKGLKCHSQLWNLARPVDETRTLLSTVLTLPTAAMPRMTDKVRALTDIEYNAEVAGCIAFPKTNRTYGRISKPLLISTASLTHIDTTSRGNAGYHDSDIFSGITASLSLSWWHCGIGTVHR